MKTRSFARIMVFAVVSLMMGIGVLNIAVSYAQDRLVIKDGSGNTKLTITDQGYIGIGTTTPGQKIDLGAGAITLKGADNTGTRVPSLAAFPGDLGRIDFGYGGSGGGNLEAYSKAPPNYSGADDRRGQFRYVYGGGTNLGRIIFIHYDGANWVQHMWLDYNGYLTMSGGAYTDGQRWINGSSRAYKENIESLDSREALDTLASLEPVKFNYKSDTSGKHVGFIAEDVPELVATKDRKGMSAMDVVAVLTKVVQEQQRVAQKQQESLKELKTRNEMLEQRLLALEGKVVAGK